jgi:hypothetical protein
MRITVGDKVRVHYHPPGMAKSFVEGVVSDVDVPTKLGRVFVVDVTSNVIYGREQPIKPRYQRHILYERSDDFPGRIELLSQSEKQPEPEAEPAPEQEVMREVELEATPASEPEQAEDQGSRGLENVVRVLFGRRT